MFVHGKYSQSGPAEVVFRDRSPASEGVAVGTLYLVATPIGNLEDITARALRVLREVSLIAAEDTRHTGKLLSHFGISTPMISLHQHNERARREHLLAALTSGDVAVVSDAGTPGISDPGFDLVAAAVAGGIPVSPIPGPSSVIAAISAAGLVPGPFVNLGFIPRSGAERRQLLLRAGQTGFPIVLFEAANRLETTLVELKELLGDRMAVVARELTKVYEEFRRGSLTELADHYSAEPARGEIVVIVGEATPPEPDTADPAEIVASLLKAGLKPSAAAREAAALTGLPRADVYAIAMSLGKDMPTNS
jgi:16S rRNA (cytidine1402-2'-O)-methyltransferase